MMYFFKWGLDQKLVMGPKVSLGSPGHDPQFENLVLVSKYAKFGWGYLHKLLF